MPADFGSGIGTELTEASDVTSSATGWAGRVVTLLSSLVGSSNAFGTAALIDAATSTDAAEKVLLGDSLGRLPAVNLTSPIPAANLPTGEDAGEIPIIGSSGLLAEGIIPILGLSFENVGSPISSSISMWTIPSNVKAVIVCCVGAGAAAETEEIVRSLWQTTALRLEQFYRRIALTKIKRMCGNG